MLHERSQKRQTILFGICARIQNETPLFKKEGRKQIKVYYLNPEEDLPIKSLLEIIKEAQKLY